ncbi:hypothetical protein BB560_000506 [Smittium megazygosporum]|uniref:Uncharacterized protein n=1 Tax=Smittium megazygosporum TaxID=133381 RepID=A0A2T9ZKA3_9FUNG|nr:hypothetical protein BB560_000506 [Smittium megazygosporum]
MSVQTVVLSALVGLGSLLWLSLNSKSKAKRTVSNKTVVIIGASSGIGKETALEFARLGANLLLVARREAELLEVEKQCMEINPSIKVRILSADITRTEEVSKIHSVLASFKQNEEVSKDGKSQSDITTTASSTTKDSKVSNQDTDTVPVDFLILNAGIISVQTVTAMVLDDKNPSFMESSLDHIMQVNFFAPVKLCNLLLPNIVACSGSISVVSSMGGLLPAPTRSLYCASKAAVILYFGSLRLELERLGVSVSIICPGTVNTNLRNSAVDLPPSSTTSTTSSPSTIPGSTTGKASPEYSAKVIIDAATSNKPLVLFPFKYKVAYTLYPFFSGFIDKMAKKKYGF